MVDAHAEILVEVAGTIVPPRISIGFGMAQAVRIAQAGPAKSSKRFPLRFRHMRPTMTCLRIPDVNVLRRNIEVASNHNGHTGASCFLQPLSEAAKPDKL